MNAMQHHYLTIHLSVYTIYPRKLDKNCILQINFGKSVKSAHSSQTSVWKFLYKRFKSNFNEEIAGLFVKPFDDFI